MTYNLITKLKFDKINQSYYRYSKSDKILKTFLRQFLKNFLKPLISKDIHTLIYFLKGIAINLRRNGLKASILIAKYGLLRSFYITSNLSEVKSDKEINYISSNLQSKGISFLPNLEEIDIKKILSQYKKKMPTCLRKKL